MQGKTVCDYVLMPVFSNLLEPDEGMSALVERVRQPFAQSLGEVLAVTDDLLYRRGNFNGSFDEIILAALRQSQDAEIALSPGFRWGTTLLPGSAITVEDVMAQTAITYPGISVRDLTGAQIKDALEDIADNLFNPRSLLPPGWRHGAYARPELRLQPAGFGRPAHIGSQIEREAPELPQVLSGRRMGIGQRNRRRRRPGLEAGAGLLEKPDDCSHRLVNTPKLL